ncbi:MAG: glycosyl transferase family 28 [Segetibacter sp.]|nr:glycosyl transferase family 28 [Segetibacter sp.]
MPKKFNTTVLVAPLDWGIGHATRCIPIINQLLHSNCRVIIAAEGLQKHLLQLEFPHLQILPLMGYRITYSTNKRLLPLKIILQLPKVFKAIRNERKWLRNAITEFGINVVISDNRYGLQDSRVKCVIITHQLTIKAPLAIIERVMQSINYSFIKMFDYCWVPDEKGETNLAGILSHPKKLPTIPVQYLGALSRLNTKKASETKYDLLCIISGPEPQRSLLENKLLKNLEQYNGRVLFIRGLPGSRRVIPSFKDLTIVNHLPAAELEKAFNESTYVISRTGYTTVMDLCKLQKKAILIPTPGQTEQEYLAKHLYKQQWCLYYQQDKFSLNEALKKAETFPFKIPPFTMDSYKEIVDELVNSLHRAEVDVTTFAIK